MIPNLLRSAAMFQFHSGSIQTDLNVWMEQKQEVFQFHSGSIQTIVPPLYLFVTEGFQFHSGSIQTELSCWLAALFLIVSIPLWFDSNSSGRQTAMLIT